MFLLALPPVCSLSPVGCQPEPEAKVIQEKAAMLKRGRSVNLRGDTNAIAEAKSIQEEVSMLGQKVSRCRRKK
jgi:hypothetical protein